MHHYESSLLQCCHSEQLRNGEQMFRLLCTMRPLNEHYIRFETVNMPKTNALFHTDECFYNACPLPWLVLHDTPVVS